MKINILIQSHSMCKQPAESAPNPKTAQKTKMSKELRPWTFSKNRTQVGKNNKCTCFASRQ
jgi:hypothetical protein